MLRADLYGNIIEKLDIRLNGKDPSILCINHVEDRLVIGYKDDSTNRAEVIVPDKQRKEVARKKIDSEVYAIQMVASERGLLFARAIADKRNGMSVFFLSEIDSAGEILFEYRDDCDTGS